MFRFLRSLGPRGENWVIGFMAVLIVGCIVIPVLLTVLHVA